MLTTTVCTNYSLSFSATFLHFDKIFINWLVMKQFLTFHEFFFFSSKENNFLAFVWLVKLTLIYLMQNYSNYQYGEGNMKSLKVYGER